VVASLFLRKSETRKVSKSGVRFKNRDYFDVRLLAYVGQEVQLGYSEHDPSFLHLFRGGRWLLKIHPIEDATPHEMDDLVRKRHKQLALVRRVQGKAAAARSATSPADHETSSSVNRGKTARAAKPTRKGKALLHRLRKRTGDGGA